MVVKRNVDIKTQLYLKNKSILVRFCSITIPFEIKMYTEIRISTSFNFMQLILRTERHLISKPKMQLTCVIENDTFHIHVFFFFHFFVLDD